MNTIVQNQLARLENALNTLIDSIASYNPSIPAATELVIAEDGLNESIKQLTTHQTNYGRILHLREIIDTLNQTISSNLTLLAETRKDLLATPATNFPEDQRNVPYNELLDYAKRISRYTIPPTFRPPPSTTQTSSVAVPQSAEQPTNGAPEKQIAQDPSSVPPDNNEAQGEGIGVASLDQGHMQWLDPLKQIPFVPWPSEEVIRQGALAQIQVMLDQRIDPSNASVVQDEAMKNEADIEGKLAEHPDDESVKDTVKRNGENGIVKVEKREEKPKVFGGLDLYDPDEE